MGAKIIDSTRTVAKWYDEFYEKSGVFTNEAEARHMLDLLNPKPGKRLLDVACGGGYLLRLASQRSVDTYGVEISKVAVKAAKKISPQSKVLYGNAEKLPFKKEAFDYVTCLGSIEHFHHMEKAIREMARVMKKEGLACLYVPNSYFLYHCWSAFRTGAGPTDGQDYERYLSKLEWKNLFENNGLNALEIHKDNYPVRSLLGSIKPLIPLNVSYAFIFICGKGI